MIARLLEEKALPPAALVSAIATAAAAEDVFCGHLKRSQGHTLLS